MKTNQQEPPPLSISLPPIRSRFLLLFLSLSAGFFACSFLNSVAPIQISSFITIPPLPSSKPNLSLAGLQEPIKPKWVWHRMTDEELLRKASMVQRGSNEPSGRVPKVAFLFLARGPLPFAPLWEKFFAGHDGLFSLYVHLNPSYHETFPADSVFFGRRIPSKAVQWGEPSMMKAERRLLANALLDISNERFVLLSESCIPLFSFPEIYSYLINSSTTFLESYDDPGPTGRGRYSPKMRPTVRLEQWRKGSQWFETDRFLALEIVRDRVFFPVFAKYCKGSCYSDEHYLPTMVAARWPGRNANRTLTWVDWSSGGPHPTRFWRPAVTLDLLRQMRNNSTCSYNGKNTTVCYLFARKFLPSAINRLLLFAPKVLGFG